MQVNLYSTSSENNRVDKQLTNIATLSGTLREQCSIITPTITIQGDISQLSKANYCYIPEFSRYYYINNIIILNNSLCRIECSVDVLMTYKSQIRSLSGVIERQENEYNLYLEDGAFKTQARDNILTKGFPTGFSNDGSFILAVAGG